MVGRSAAKIEFCTSEPGVQYKLRAGSATSGGGAAPVAGGAGGEDCHWITVGCSVPGSWGRVRELRISGSGSPGVAEVEGELDGAVEPAPAGFEVCAKSRWRAYQLPEPVSRVATALLTGTCPGAETVVEANCIPPLAGGCS